MIALIAVNIPTFRAARMNLMVWFCYVLLVLQVVFLSWLSRGWLFKFRQGRKLLVQSDWF